jgi:hypothetical protein
MFGESHENDFFFFRTSTHNDYEVFGLLLNQFGPLQRLENIGKYTKFPQISFTAASTVSKQCK